MGQIALENGKVAWAYSLLRENVHQLPDDPTFLHDFAQAAYELGKIGQAQSAMQKLVDLNPNGPQASDAKKFLAMAALESQPQAAVAAEAEINRILADEPAYVPALIARAVAQSQRDQIQAAIETLRRILRDSPDCALAQKHLATLYLRDPDQVDSAYELAAKAHKVLTDDPELSEILGEISYRKKEYARAIQLLQEGARGKPLDAKALFYLGMSQLQAKLEPEGRQTLERALAAALEEPLAAEARQALEALPKQDRSVQP